MRTIRRIEDGDRARLRGLVVAGWGATRMVTRGRLVDVAALPGFVAEDHGEWLGYATCELRGGALEISVIESLAPGGGVGSALLAACVGEAVSHDAQRVWLITTNDNLAALRFYQRRGFVLVALHRDAITQARAEVKPEISLVGADGIPIRDELELELPRSVWPAFVAQHEWPR